MNKTAYLILSLAAAALCSCGKDHASSGPASPAPLVLTAKVFSLAQSTPAIWSGNQKVGLFVVDSRSQQVSGGYANVPYVADSYGTNGYLVPEGANPVYLPADGSACNLISYYPYSSAVSASEPYMLDVELNAATAADSYLYSNNVKGVSSLAPKAEAQFHSMLAEVVLEIKATDFAPASVSATLAQQPRKAQFSVLAGEYTAFSGYADLAFTEATAAVGADFTSHAVIMADCGGSDSQLKMTAQTRSGDTVNYQPVTLDKLIKLQGGKVQRNTRYRVSVNIDSTGAITTQLLSASPLCILDWDSSSDSTTGGTARPDDTTQNI